MPKLAGRFDTLPQYALATIPQKKRELAARGVDVIDLGAGDADLAPPPKAVDAISKAVHEPAMSRYGFGLGLVPYREAISAWMARRFGVRFDVVGFDCRFGCLGVSGCGLIKSQAFAALGGIVLHVTSLWNASPLPGCWRGLQDHAIPAGFLGCPDRMNWSRSPRRTRS